MEGEGKFVRAASSSNREQTDLHNLNDSEYSDDQSQECNVSERSCESNQEQNESDSSTASDSPSHSSVSSEKDERIDPEGPEASVLPEEPKGKKSKTVEKIEHLEKVIAEMSKTLSAYERQSNRTRPDIDENWSVPHDSTDRAAGIQATVRWDHIKPYPNGIPASRMWEEWNRFIENFEIATSLGNAVSAEQRSKILFLCMGQELQGIVRAAKLRPSLAEPDCYSVFVNNVQRYLQSMTDTAAEHEAFAGMKQGPEESAVAFHARLQEKVRLCGYSTIA